MESQVKKWAQLYKAHKIQPIPAMDRLIDWLLLHLPKHQRTTLLHGSFRFDIFTHTVVLLTEHCK